MSYSKLLGLCRPFVPHRGLFSSNAILRAIHNRHYLRLVLITILNHQLHISRQDLLPRINILDHLLRLTMPLHIHLHEPDTQQHMALTTRLHALIAHQTKAPRRRVRAREVKRKRKKNISQALALRESIETKIPASLRLTAHTKQHPARTRVHLLSTRCRNHLYQGRRLRFVSRST